MCVRVARTLSLVCLSAPAARLEPTALVLRRGWRARRESQRERERERERRQHFLSFVRRLVSRGSSAGRCRRLGWLCCCRRASLVRSLARWLSLSLSLFSWCRRRAAALPPKFACVATTAAAVAAAAACAAARWLSRALHPPPVRMCLIRECLSARNFNEFYYYCRCLFPFLDNHLDQFII